MYYLKLIVQNVSVYLHGLEMGASKKKLPLRSGVKWEWWDENGGCKVGVDFCCYNFLLLLTF